MGRARDISKVFSTGTALATNTEVSGSYLTLASASTTYQTKATAGLTLLNTTSFSAQTTVSINDVFSATYTNYKLMLILTSAAVDTSVYFKLRVGGADESGSFYTYSRIQTINNATPANQNSTNSNAGWEILDMDAGTTGNKYVFQMDLFDPFGTVNTNAHFTYKGFGTTGNPLFGVSGSILNTLTSYTGFTIVSSSNLAGTVSVYGYNK